MRDSSKRKCFAHEARVVPIVCNSRYVLKRCIEICLGLEGSCIPRPAVLDTTFNKAGTRAAGSCPGALFETAAEPHNELHVRNGTGIVHNSARLFCIVRCALVIAVGTAVPESRVSTGPQRLSHVRTAFAWSALRGPPRTKRLPSSILCSQYTYMRTRIQPCDVICVFETPTVPTLQCIGQAGACVTARDVSHTRCDIPAEAP